MNGIMSNAKIGKSNLMVVEADESDASFLYLDPKWIIVTSVDVDVNLNIAPYSHLNFDYEKTFEKVRDAFFQFIDRLPEDGKAILCIDDDNIRNMLPEIKKDYITYGISSDAFIRAENIHYKNFGSTFDVFYGDSFLGVMKLKTPGRHNVQNSLAVLAVGLELGMTFEEVARSLLNFRGVKRRFEKLGEFNDILIFDDYAHNPAKGKSSAQRSPYRRKTGG
jgi:UDP-N-acetylmuramate--alanine ligase